jgi:hypothetical protein
MYWHFKVSKRHRFGPLGLGDYFGYFLKLDEIYQFSGHPVEPSSCKLKLIHPLFRPK